MFVKGLKAGEADFVEKDWPAGPGPSEEPGLVSVSTRSEQGTCGSPSSCPLGASTSGTREGHVCVALQRSYLSLSCPLTPILSSERWVSQEGLCVT